MNEQNTENIEDPEVMEQMAPQEEVRERNIKLIKVYSLRLLSMLDLKPHDVAYSLELRNLTKVHNEAHMDEPYKLSAYPNFSFIYKEGSPFQWFIEPVEELKAQVMVGIFDNWIESEQLENLKKTVYFV